MSAGALLWSWYGAIWPNLAASGICAALVIWRSRVHHSALGQRIERLEHGHAEPQPAAEHERGQGVAPDHSAGLAG